MTDDSNITSALEILDSLRLVPVKSVIIRQTETCEVLLAKLGLLSAFSTVDESGFSSALFEHGNHYIIAARWLEHPDDDKGFYQLFCTPRTETTSGEALEIISYLRFFYSQQS